MENICRPVCPSNIACKPHRLLNVLKFFSENLREKNIYNDIIGPKIIIRECTHKGCMNNWCFEYYETKYAGREAPIRWRSNVL